MDKLLFKTIITEIPLLFTCFRDCASNYDESSWADTGDDFGYSEYTEDETKTDDNSIKVAYTEQYGNTITIPVKINGMGLDMIFDQWLLLPV